MLDEEQDIAFTLPRVKTFSGDSLWKMLSSVLQNVTVCGINDRNKGGTAHVYLSLTAPFA